MATAWVECWKCELCGHKWIRVPDAAPPRLCSKCKKTGWHSGAVAQSAEQGTHNSRGVGSIPTGPTIEDLRAICSGHFTPVSEAVEIKMCQYREYDQEQGEWYGCRLPEHGPKIKHASGPKL